MSELPGPASDTPAAMTELESLKRSHALLTNFSRCLSGMFYQYRRYPDGRFCFPYASDAVETFFGVKAEQLREDASMLFNKIHPDDLPKIIAGVRKSFSELSIWRQEYRIITADQQDRWVTGEATPEQLPDGSVLWHGFLSDNTERKLTEQRLQAAERQRRLVMKASNQGLYDINLQTGKGTFSPEYIQMLGYAPDDFSDPQQFWDYFWGSGVHPDDVVALKRAYKAHATAKGSSDYHAEFRQKNKAGDWRWIMSMGSIVEWDANGQPLRMVGTHIDITERKQTEEMLRQNQALLKANNNRYKELARELEILITNAPVGIMFVSDGIIVRANKALAELCRFPDAQSMIGVKTTFLYRGLDDYHKFNAQVTPSLQADELVELEWHLRRFNGDLFMGRVAGRALPTESYVRGAVWMIEDITAQTTTLDALRSSEQRLQKLMNSSLIGIIQGNEAGQILDVNDVFIQFSGYNRDYLLTQSHVWETLLSPQDLKICQQAYVELLKTGTTAPFEIMLQQDGHVGVPILVGLSHLENSDLGWVAFAMDISDRLRMNRLKTEFISVVSHELRTPLTSIRGSLSLLESGVSGVLPKQAEHLIRIAHNNSKRLITLVNDILDMDKLASGKMIFKSEAMDLVALVRNSIESNMAYASSLKIGLQLRAHPQQAWILADHDRLMQVMANLISNAAKFSREGESVLLRVVSTGSRYRVEVSDCGAGIAPEFQQHLFEPFTQADGTDTRKKGGTGLGLSITKAMLEKMHGQIGFQSTPDIGSTFWFEFDVYR
ncbi:PAS domain-containing protein [Undibacterium sp. TJN19]|uniref:PAS domain-containing protein n=1 Tax=Undibacterium sp. TJN19 TaxID=3413055 RepID=UPI003BF2A573